MKLVVFHRDAETELGAAILYYQEQRWGLGLDFQAEVEKYARMIPTDPHR